MNTSVRGADGIAAEFVGLDRAPREQPPRRIQPQRLLQHLVGEGERLRRRRGAACRRRCGRPRPRARAAVSGCRLIRYQVQVSAAAVVSWPATIRVITSSISSLSLIAVVGVAIARRHQHAQEIEMLLGVSRRRRSISSRDQLGERAEAKREFQVAILFLGDHLEGIGAQLPLEALEIAAEDRAAARSRGSVRSHRRSD